MKFQWTGIGLVFGAAVGLLLGMLVFVVPALAAGPNALAVPSIQRSCGIATCRRQWVPGTSPGATVVVCATRRATAAMTAPVDD